MTSYVAGLGHAFANEFHTLSSAHHSKLKRVSLLATVFVATITLASVAVQLLYPRTYTTPLLRAGGISFGAVDQPEARRRLDNLGKQTFTIQAKNQQYTIAYQEAGVGIDQGVTTRDLFSYDWRQRLVPFSLFRRSNEATIARSYDSTKMQQLADKIVAENSRSAKDATIAKQADKYVITPSEDGAGYQAAAIIPLIKSVGFSAKATVAVPGDVVKPRVTSQAFDQAVATATQQAKQPMKLSVAGAELTLSPQELWSMINVVVDPVTGKVIITHDQALIKQKVTVLANQVYIAPKPATVATYDNVETSRTGGESGRQLSMDASLAAIDDALNKNQTAVALQTQVIAPGAKSTKSYSPTANGINLMVKEWASRRRGTFSMVVRRMGGDGLAASFQPGIDYAPASTYKIFIAELIYQKLESGALSEQATTNIGCVIRACIRDMIVRSSDSHAHSLADLYGWNTLDAYVKSNGYTHTIMVRNDGRLHTTANDLNQWFVDFYNGGTMSANDRSELLGFMRTQIYRKGIPAGAAPYVVADKVGFYDDWYNDAGIVYAPIPYVLAITSKGGSLGEIADLTRLVNIAMQGGTVTL